MNRRRVFKLGTTAIVSVLVPATHRTAAATPTPQPTAQLGEATVGVQIVMTGTQGEFNQLVAKAQAADEDLGDYVTNRVMRVDHIRH